MAQDVVIVATRRIVRPPKKGSAVQRPRTRTLTAVHDGILEDVVYPAEIVGKRVRYRLDGAKIIKVDASILLSSDNLHHVLFSNWRMSQPHGHLYWLLYLLVQKHLKFALAFVIYTCFCDIIYGLANILQQVLNLFLWCHSDLLGPKGEEQHRIQAGDLHCSLPQAVWERRGLWVPYDRKRIKMMPWISPFHFVESGCFVGVSTSLLPMYFKNHSFDAKVVA